MIRDNILLTQERSALSGFLESYAKNKKANAIHINNVAYTYDDVMRISLKILEQIKKEAGTEKNKFIGLYADHTVYTYASIIAIMLNGSGYVPLNSKFPSERNGVICSEAELKIILAGEQSKESIQEICKHATVKLTHVCNTVVADKEASVVLPETNIFKDDYVYMMFTSGSTGKPKGVPISHKNVVHYLKIMTQYGLYDFTPEDRFLQAIELTFDMSILGIFVAWEVGGCVYPVKLDGLAYLNILKTLQEHKITVSYVVPSVVTYSKKYLEAGEINLSHLRYSFFAGEALFVSHVKAWMVAAKTSIIENVFGPTEATNTFLRYRWNKELSEKEAINGAVSIGRPNPGIATTIISETDEIVKDGERGQLCVYGDQVADGYWKDKEKTDRSFVHLPSSGLPGRWYKTGDLAYLNENGNYIYCGRCDNQIKINGFRVELDEIEFHIRNIVNLEMVAVLYRSNAPEGIFGFIEADNPSWDNEKVLSQLTEFVPEYMIPRSITVLKKMPLNINGKIDRNALKELIQEKK